MYNEWSLNSLYKGSDDPQINTDIERLKSALAEYRCDVSGLNDTAEEPVKVLKRLVLAREEITVLVR